MVYKVELTLEAIANIRAIYNYIGASRAPAAARWYRGLRERIFSLDQLPQRGRRTPEDENLFHLLYGNKPHLYRIIYAVNETSRVVTILHIRHGARLPFSAGEL